MDLLHRELRTYEKRTHSALDLSSFKSLRNRYHNLILSAKKNYYSNFVSSSSVSPNISGKLLTISYIVNYHHRYLLSLLLYLLLIVSALSSLIKFPNSVLHSLTTLTLFLHTYYLPHQHLLTSLLLYLPLSLKSPKFFSTVLINSVILILFPHGLSNPVLLFLFLQSPTLLISLCQLWPVSSYS